MVRISSGFISKTVLNNIQANMNELYKIQSKLSSGKKFEKASENQIDSNRIMKLRDIISKNDQYKKNIEMMEPIAKMSSSMMSDINKKLNSASTIASQYFNPTSDKATLASQLDAIIKSVMQSGNASYDGKYLYSGYNFQEKPFVMEGDRVRYTGSNDHVSAAFSDEESLEISIPGDELFIAHSITGKIEYGTKNTKISGLTFNQFKLTVDGKQPIKVTVGKPLDGITDQGAIKEILDNITVQDVVDAINTSGAEVRAYLQESNNGFKVKITSNYIGESGKIAFEDLATDNKGILDKMGFVDNDNKIVGTQSDYEKCVLDILIRLKNAVSAGDNAKVSTYSNRLKDGTSDLLSRSGRLGIIIQQMESLKKFIADNTVLLKNVISELQDVDYAETMMEFNEIQNTYQAAMQVGARIMKSSLINFM